QAVEVVASGPGVADLHCFSRCHQKGCPRKRDRRLESSIEVKRKELCAVVDYVVDQVPCSRGQRGGIVDAGTDPVAAVANVAVDEVGATIVPKLDVERVLAAEPSAEYAEGARACSGIDPRLNRKRVQCQPFGGTRNADCGTCAVEAKGLPDQTRG